MKRSILHAVLLGSCFILPATAQDSLYLRLGGQAGVASIVNQSVTPWLANDRIKADFDNIDPDRLKTRLADQICQITNGPCVYRGRSMAASHTALGLTRVKFNAVAEDVQTAMEQVGIPYRTQNQLMALLAPMQRDIVTR